MVYNARNDIETRGEDMIHVNCPICGKKLIEGKEGSSISIQCGKCKQIIIASINHDELVTTYTAEENDGQYTTNAGDKAHDSPRRGSSEIIANCQKNNFKKPNKKT